MYGCYAMYVGCVMYVCYVLLRMKVLLCSYLCYGMYVFLMLNIDFMLCMYVL